MTLEAFLLEMAGLVPYEKRTVKGHIAREDMARKLLLVVKADQELLERAADTIQDLCYTENSGFENMTHFMAREIKKRLEAK
jgi:hypothetical protein